MRREALATCDQVAQGWEVRVGVEQRMGTGRYANGLILVYKYHR